MTDTTSLAHLLHLHGNALTEGDPIAPPLVSSSMYHLPGSPEGNPTYGRVDNPTWEALEHMLAHLERAPVLAFPSGMAAITAALFATLKSGDRLLVPSDGYYVTRVMAAEFLAGLGVEVVERSTKDFTKGGFAGFRVVFLETPSNPGLELLDIAAISTEVRDAGGITIVDNTTLTALGQMPLDLGADIVVASDTKAPSGHSDLLMGHVATRDTQIFQRVKQWRNISGSIPAPQAAWLLHRGLETLEVRYARMCDTAAALAEVLDAHPAVQSVSFPGLKSSPSYALACRQMTSFGFLISFEVSDAIQADSFINACPFLRPATSFGGVHSSAERRARWGDDVADGAIRLSVGCEPKDAFIAAIIEALDAVSSN